jgi:hypothetical protein
MLLYGWFYFHFLTGHANCTKSECLLNKRTLQVNDITYQVTSSELPAKVNGHLGSTTEKILNVGDFGLLSALAW